MKWNILLLLTVAVFPAYANDYYTGIKVGIEESNTSSSASTKFGIILGKRIHNNFDVEFVSKMKSIHSGGNGTKIEGGLISKYRPFYIRTAIGNKYVSGRDNFGYWSIEGGSKIKIADKWSAAAGIRFRNAFNTKRNQKDHTFKMELGYKLTEFIGMSVSYDLKRARDSDANSYGIGLKYEF
jgi:hypothetical protein